MPFVPRLGEAAAGLAAPSRRLSVECRPRWFLRESASSRWPIEGDRSAIGRDAPSLVLAGLGTEQQQREPEPSRRRALLDSGCRVPSVSLVPEANAVLTAA